MTKIGVIQPDTLRHRVEDALRDAITSGIYRPGKRLIERELCEDLGVSRASVREALRRLEAEKLVNIVPHRGPVVATISLEDARQLYELRTLLEGFAASGFVRKATSEQIADCETAAAELRIAAERQDQNGVLQAKAKLYDTILGNCGNIHVWETLRGLHSRVNLLRATSLMDTDRLPKSLTEIDALIRAFKDRDAKKAGKIARLHVENASQVAFRYLEEQAPATEAL